MYLEGRLAEFREFLATAFAITEARYRGATPGVTS